MQPEFARWLLPLVLALCLLACGGSEQARPDLSRLYASADPQAAQPPVILIHGLMGSRLREINSGREVWPGPLSRLLTSDYRELALDDDGPALEPHALFESAAGRDFYGAIVRTLEEAGGYRRGQPGQLQPLGQRRYYLLLYDWRQDNLQAARALDELIEQIRLDYGQPAMKVDLVAHSMGGLIARYFLRYGSVDVLDRNDFPVNSLGASKVRRTILLGTPNFGSVSALTGLIDGVQVGLRSIPPEVLATMPSAPQLFPHALHEWIITPQGKVLERDQFSAELWRRFGWGPYDPAVVSRVRQRGGESTVSELQERFARNLERARRFTWSLSVPAPASSVQLIVFGGSCQLTPARLVVEPTADDFAIRRWPDEVRNPPAGVDLDRLMLEPGDGTVTKASLLARHELDPRLPRHRHSFFPLDYSVFLCERHDRLTGNPSFQDNLLQALLQVDQR